MNPPGRNLLLLAAGLALISTARAQLVAPGESPKRVASDLRFGEGPTRDPAGNVYFVDQPNDRILEWNAKTDAVTTFLQPSGYSNGLCFDADGNLWACADEKNELWKIRPADKKVEVVLKNFEGRLLNGPNDLWFRPDGGLYFTDPYYSRPYWKRDPAEQNPRGVYYLSADRKRLVRVADGMVQPNGIIGTPDGKTLYVADHSGRKTYRFDIQPDGSLTNRQLFCEMGSDGMTIDEQGNVYLTYDSVFVFSSAGKQISRIDFPDGPTNVCFGGADRKTLFVTTPHAAYTLPMLVRGASVQ
jgi:gluconolactonase